MLCIIIIFKRPYQRDRPLRTLGEHHYLDDIAVCENDVNRLRFVDIIGLLKNFVFVNRYFAVAARYLRCNSDFEHAAESGTFGVL